jgi:hypothetical protein
MPVENYLTTADQMNTELFPQFHILREKHFQMTNVATLAST